VKELIDDMNDSPMLGLAEVKYVSSKVDDDEEAEN